MKKKQVVLEYSAEKFVEACEAQVVKLLIMNGVVLDSDDAVEKETEFIADIIVGAQELTVAKGCREKHCYDRGYIGFDSRGAIVICHCTKLKLEKIFKSRWADRKLKEQSFTKPEVPNAPAC